MIMVLKTRQYQEFKKQTFLNILGYYEH